MLITKQHRPSLALLTVYLFDEKHINFRYTSINTLWMIFFLAYLYVTKTQFDGSSIMAPNSSLSEPWQKSAIPDLMNESINEKIMFQNSLSFTKIKFSVQNFCESEF